MPDSHIIRIDQLIGIDLAAVTLSDIRWKYGTGISTATGSKRAGTYKPGYRNGVMTDIGDIREDVWCQIVEHIARRDGEEWLVDALTEWGDVHNYAKSSHKEVRIEALDLYSSRIFDDPKWVGYIPFNRKYRPDIMDQSQIVTVVNTCCGKMGEVTRQQIEYAYDGKISCPHCGRWSTFFLVGD